MIASPPQQPDESRVYGGADRGPLSARSLARAVNSGWKALSDIRERRQRVLVEITGPGAGAPTAVNLLAQMYDILLSNLAPKDIKAKVDSWDMGKKFEGVKIGLALDRAAENDCLSDTVRTAVGESLISPVAIVRSGLRVGSELFTVDGRAYDPGQLFTKPVSLDDYACDTSATSWNEITWEADRVRVPRSVLMSMPGIDQDQVEALQKVERGDKNNSAAAERASDNEDHDLIDTVEVWHVAVYLPEETKIYLLGARPGSQSEPCVDSESELYCGTFEGPEEGPYSRLMLSPLPGMLFGMCPADKSYKMHQAMQAITDRMIAMAQNTKRILGYRSTATDQTNLIIKAGTFEAVKMDAPEDAKMFDFGGVPVELYEAVGWFQKQWNNATGNLSLIGGVESNSNTATEASYLQANSNLMMNDMQDKVRKFLRSIQKQRAWYIINDPMLDQKYAMRLPGGDMLQVHYSAEMRESTPNDFSYDVDTQAPQSQDIMLRWRRLIEFFSQVVPAMMPLVQLGAVDLSAVLRLFSREFGIQELDEIARDPTLAMQTAAIHGGPPTPAAKEGGQFGVSPTPAQQQVADRASAMSPMAPQM